MTIFRLYAVVIQYIHVFIFSTLNRTGFHADVFRSYSWSANICGEKKWIIFPPGIIKDEIIYFIQCYLVISGYLIY